MTDISDFLGKHKKTIEDYIEMVNAFLRNNKVKHVAWAYSERKSSREEESSMCLSWLQTYITEKISTVIL